MVGNHLHCNAHNNVDKTAKAMATPQCTIDVQSKSFVVQLSNIPTIPPKRLENYRCREFSIEVKSIIIMMT